MKNSFIKEHKGILTGSLIAGAALAGTIVYLYVTESGSKTRENFIHKVKDIAKDTVASYVSGKTRISKETLKKVADHFVK